MGRTEKSKKNMLISIFGQTFILFISFVTRSVFVRTLNAEFLGLNGLFTNIVNVLSLAELGIGVAITYSLYKPIAEDNIDEITAIMFFYKKVYKYIGTFILVSGILMTPALDFFIKDIEDIPFLKIYFMLYILNSVFTYFYTYKQSLVIAHQNNYIVALNRYLFIFIRNVLQIIVLISYNSFFAYLIIQMIFTLIENITISKIADRLYPYINNKQQQSIKNDTSKEIKKNTLAMLLHKIGSVVVNGTDNIIISKFVGLISVGLYSNYWLIVSSLHSVYNQGFSSLTASIGNLGVTQPKDKSLRVFKNIYFVNFWIYSFSSISLMILFNPFISLWLNEAYLLPQSTVYLIVINFYITGMRTGVNTFKNSYGLFWNDRYKPLIESIVNITTSLLLVGQFGINGVLLGTLISTLTTSFWIEPYVLYKHGFDEKLYGYMKLYLKYGIITIFAGTVTKYIASFLNGTSYILFFMYMLICVIVPNFIILLLLIKSHELKSVLNILFSKHK